MGSVKACIDGNCKQATIRGPHNQPQLKPRVPRMGGNKFEAMMNKMAGDVDSIGDVERAFEMPTSIFAPSRPHARKPLLLRPRTQRMGGNSEMAGDMMDTDGGM